MYNACIAYQQCVYHMAKFCGLKFFSFFFFLTDHIQKVKSFVDRETDENSNGVISCFKLYTYMCALQ